MSGCDLFINNVGSTFEIESVAVITPFFEIVKVYYLERATPFCVGGVKNLIKKTHRFVTKILFTNLFLILSRFHKIKFIN